MLAQRINVKVIFNRAVSAGRGKEKKALLDRAFHIRRDSAKMNSTVAINCIFVPKKHVGLLLNVA